MGITAIAGDCPHDIHGFLRWMVTFWDYHAELQVEEGARADCEDAAYFYDCMAHQYQTLATPQQRGRG